MSVKVAIFVAAKVAVLFHGYDVPVTADPASFCAGVRFGLEAFHPIEKGFEDAPIVLEDKAGKEVLRCNADGSYEPYRPLAPWYTNGQFQTAPLVLPSGK